jgi:hypothetical protein
MHPCIKFASADAPEVSAEKNAALKPRIELNASDKFRRIESPGTLSAQTAGRKKTPPRARQGYGLFSFSSVSASLVIHVSARGELAGSGAQKARVVPPRLHCAIHSGRLFPVDRTVQGIVVHEHSPRGIGKH